MSKRAGQFHRDLQAWHEGLLQEFKDRMLMIVGVGEKGLFRLEFGSLFWGAWEHTQKICSRITGDVNRDGDGRVPLASAELEDVTLRYVKGAHRSLTNIPAVAAEVLAWLEGKTLSLPTTAKGAMGQHLSAEDGTSLAPTLDGSNRADLFRSLPDYESPTQAFKASIEKKLEDGQMPKVNRARLL